MQAGPVQCGRTPRRATPRPRSPLTEGLSARAGNGPGARRSNPFGTVTSSTHPVQPLFSRGTDHIEREFQMIFDPRVARMAIGLAILCAATAVTAAPKPVVRPQAAARLAAYHWDLVGWTGGQAPQGKLLRLDFTGSRFSTDTLCNRASGAYRVNGTSIRLGDDKGQFATTLMACPEPAMTVERAYLKSLAAVRTWRIEGDHLLLRTAKGETMTYRAAHKPAADAPRKFIYVSAETKPCTGVAPMTCLQVREKESDPWQLHYGGIVDFDPQPGIAYRLRIIEEKIANPPADASSIRWTLDQVIEQHVVNR